MFIDVDVGSFAANRLTRRSSPPRWSWLVTATLPGSGRAVAIPDSAVSRSIPARPATVIAIATFSLNVIHGNRRSSASLTDPGSTGSSTQPRRSASSRRTARWSRSAVTHTPPRGIERASERATSSSEGPISARWSSRTFEITHIVHRISFRSLISCSSGSTAMHSMTSASGR